MKEEDEPPTVPSRRRPPVDESISMPPEVRVPEPWREHRESLLPPRARPAAGFSASFVGAAAVATYSVENPAIRAVLMLACGITVWLLGYVTQPPRRQFRRDDDRR
jgi:hypothetical protein